MAGELVGGAQEEGAVFRVAGLVEAEHGKLVAGGASRLLGALEQVFHRRAQRGGDAGDVTAELAGAVRLPLGDRAAADAARCGQFVLCEAPGAPERAYACAYCRVFLHQGRIAQFLLTNPVTCVDSRLSVALTFS